MNLYLVDNHQTDFNEVSFDEYSVDRLVKYLVDGHIDCLMLYGKDHWGWSYYDTAVGQRHPKLKFDLFAATKSVIEMGMEREVAEEVIIDTTYTAQFVGLLNDDSNDVGKVHFGIVYQLVVDKPKVEIRERGSFTRGSFCSVDDLRSDFDLFETWSQILIESFILKS